jgi:hypothetical protein
MVPGIVDCPSDGVAQWSTTLAQGKSVARGPIPPGTSTGSPSLLDGVDKRRIDLDISELYCVP